MSRVHIQPDISFSSLELLNGDHRKTRTPRLYQTPLQHWMAAPMKDWLLQSVEKCFHLKKQQAISGPSTAFSKLMQPDCFGGWHRVEYIAYFSWVAFSATCLTHHSDYYDNDRCLHTINNDNSNAVNNNKAYKENCHLQPPLTVKMTTTVTPTVTTTSTTTSTMPTTPTVTTTATSTKSTLKMRSRVRKSIKPCYAQLQVTDAEFHQ